MRIATLDAVFFSLALGAMLTGLSCEPAAYDKPNSARTESARTEVDVVASPLGADVDVNRDGEFPSPATDVAPSRGIDVEVSPQGVDVDVARDKIGVPGKIDVDISPK